MDTRSALSLRHDDMNVLAVEMASTEQFLLGFTKLSSLCLKSWREAHLFTWAFWVSLTFLLTMPQAVVVVRAFTGGFTA